MASTFGDYLALTLRQSGLKQEALAAWVSENMRGKKVSPSGVKEQLRILRDKGANASQYLLLPEIAEFFEVHGKLIAANRIQHIHAQHTHDNGPQNARSGLGSRLTSVDWLVFPEINPDSLSSHIENWGAQLRQGDRRLLGESIEFYFRYSQSYVHSMSRQSIAVELSRCAIHQGDYLHSYLVSTKCINAWNNFYRALKNGDSKYVARLQDLHDYLLLLQVQADAVSFIYYHAPALASSNLYRKCRVAIDEYKGNFREEEYEWLKTQLYIRRARMLSRAVMSIPLTERDAGSELWKDLHRSLERSLTRLLELRSDIHRMPGDTWLRGDTVIRARALLATDAGVLDQIEKDLDSLIKTEVRHASKSTDLIFKHRAASTRAIIAISRYRVQAVPASENAELKNAINTELKSAIYAVDFAIQRHVRFEVDALQAYAMYCMQPGLEVVNKSCSISEISESLKSLSEHPILLEDDAMFTVSRDDPGHLDCLFQANTFRLEDTRTPMSRARLTFPPADR